MELSERKKRLLATIIDGYIQTMEPIGSRTVCKHYGFNLSPATIRNEMAELEDFGLLIQPHTSAGRIPSDFGYRVYVEQLMNEYIPTIDETQFLNRIRQTANALDAILAQTAKILSEISNTIAIVQAPYFRKTPIKAIHMIPIDEYSVVLRVGYTNGIHRESVIRLSQSIYDESVTLLTNYLNAKLTSSSIPGI